MSNNSNINSEYDQWKGPALASCHILKLIGGYLCFAFICGVGLNIIILIIIFHKKRRTPIDIFILALCSFHLIVALFAIPLPLTSNLACRWLYGKYLCYYEGFMEYFIGMVVLYLLTALSLNRYWIIVTPSKERYTTFRTAYISIVLSVFGGLFWALPPVFGWNDYKLEGVRTSCSINWQDRTVNVISYNILMFLFAYIAPLAVMFYCNICIYLKVRSISKNMMILYQRKSLLKSRQKKHQKEQYMAKIVFVIIMTFVIAWTPYAIVAFISAFFSIELISPLGGTLPAIFAKSSVYFDPLVYILSNSYVRSRLFSWKKTIQSYGSDTSKENYDPTLALKLSRV